MQKSFRILVAAMAFAVCLVPVKGALAQEGAFHAALRHLVAIPYALLGGFLGPGCEPSGTTGDFDCGQSRQCNPGMAVAPAPNPYIAVMPAAETETQHGYVTYTLIYEKKESSQEETSAPAPTVFYHSPLPFDEVNE